MKTPSVRTTSCGLDFGTSNSSIGFADQDRTILAAFGNKVYIPSAIFFDFDLGPIFGNQAIERYVDGADGRMIWSPKNALGTGLIAEKTQIKDGGRGISFKEIIGLIVRNLKNTCEAESQSEVTNVVCGRPVFFNDDDKELDRLAQDSMFEVLKDVGFKNIEFEFEPIAAAIHYERSITEEQIAFIVDMGGGTSDFTVAKLEPTNPKKHKDRSKSILSVGGIHVAGTDFDRQLSLKSLMPEFGLGSKYKSLEGPWLPVPPSLFFDLATWHKIGFVYNNQNISYVTSKIYSSECPQKFERLLHVLRYRYGHYLARLVEKAKIELTDIDQTSIKSSDIKPAIEVDVKRTDFESSIKGQIQQIASTINSTILAAGVKAEHVDAIFMTGGSSLIPAVRKSIRSIMQNAQLLEGDKFGSVAMGLTLAAQEKFL